MRADRLLSILMLLQTKGRMTAHDLADQLEVSERTIYRDLEALSMAGVPVYTERGPGGGCSLIDGYQTRLTGLTDAEVKALFLSSIAGPLSDLGLERVLDDALLKVSAALPSNAREHAEQVRQRFHVDTHWWYHSQHTMSCLQTLQEALWRDQRLCLLYDEDDDLRRELLVEPYGLVAKAGVWYLVAASHVDYGAELVVFRVARILRATLMNEPFMRPADFDLATYWADYCARQETCYPPYSVPLRLAPDEISSLPQVLSEWGYVLMESEEPAEVEPVGHVIPFRRRREKKRALPINAAVPQSRQIKKRGAAPRHSRIAHVPNKKKLYIASHDGGWLPLVPSRQIKKSDLPLDKPERKPTAANKKKKFPASRYGSPATANKKKLFKKKLSPSLTLSLCCLCV